LKSILFFIIAIFLFGIAFSQETKQDSLILKQDTLIVKQDTINPVPAEPINLDTLLRIINLNPFFTLQVDSTLIYDLQINKPSEFYFWYLKNAPIGVKIDKNTGLLYFKAEKSYFKSGKLKYDIPYKVEVGVQNLRDAKDRIEEGFTIMFYSTEVVISKLKPTIGNTVLLEEGDSIRFRVQCETGSFPVEQITINSMAGWFLTILSGKMILPARKSLCFSSLELTNSGTAIRQL